jgi:serine/threonine-protein phosphatase 4 regulatory subunit 1
VREVILPAVLALCKDPGFRVRRAAAQALPRVLGGTNAVDASSRILPAFEALSRDEIYRVRKSTGECLVDMSRSLMILASKDPNPKAVNALRRHALIPIAENLLADANKFVRHGMMQFLGPFLASFYPFVDSALYTILPGTSESDGSNHSGIVAQFFPHASSMVSRLNSSAAATTSAPTPTLADLNTQKEISSIQELQQTLPAFVHASRASAISLKAVVAHRQAHPPDADDIRAVMGKLLDHFTGLARSNTGDENTDAEMRVYCAYSFPAVVLLLGHGNWEGRLRNCFLTLLNPNFGNPDSREAGVPPLPVKRCLASSLHTVAHVLGPKITAVDIMPVFRDHFLQDIDESVRLNMIRNFPTLLALLTLEQRSQYLLQWCETIRGEEVLGARKRSATNPLVLNWRQRDYVARSLPELMGLMDATFVHTYLWPILTAVLTDSVSVVREDAIWAIPMLFKRFCPDNVVVKVEGGNTTKGREIWSNAACKEIVGWIKENILKISLKRNGGSGKVIGNFSQRQLYCQICTAIAVALRFGDGLKDPDDPILGLETQVNKALALPDRPTSMEEDGPYRKLSSAERAHLVRLLSENFLPTALEFKDDHVTNVRLCLRKTLHMMPENLSKADSIKEAIQSLEEEVETWESYNGISDSPPPPPAHPNHSTGPTGSNGASSQAADDDALQKDGNKKKHKVKKKGHENQQGQDNTAFGQETSSMAHI